MSETLTLPEHTAEEHSGSRLGARISQAMRRTYCALFARPPEQKQVVYNIDPLGRSEDELMKTRVRYREKMLGIEREQ